MKKYLIAAICLLMVGCVGERVEVPTGHVGKVLSPTGLQKGVKNPSSFRLPYVWGWQAPYYLVLVQTSDQSMKEEIRLFMPKDKLNLAFDVRMTLSIPSDDEKKVDNIFDRLTPTQTDNDFIRTVSFNKVYDTYVSPIVREKSREVLAQYRIEQVLENREAVSAELEKTLIAELKNAPVNVLSIGLADVQPPDVIVKAQELAKQREIAIQQAEAEKLVSLTEAQAALEVAKKQQEIDLVEAETQARVNDVLAKGVTPAFVTQRALKVLETLAQSNNKVFILPEKAFNDPAVMLGVMTQAFKEEMSNGK